MMLSCGCWTSASTQAWTEREREGGEREEGWMFVWSPSTRKQINDPYVCEEDSEETCIWLLEAQDSSGVCVIDLSVYWLLGLASHSAQNAWGFGPLFPVAEHSQDYAILNILEKMVVSQLGFVISLSGSVHSTPSHECSSHRWSFVSYCNAPSADCWTEIQQVKERKAMSEGSNLIVLNLWLQNLGWVVHPLNPGIWESLS